MSQSLTPDKARNFLIDDLKSEGFDAVRIVAANAKNGQAEHLRTFIAEERHATMEWMPETEARRADPNVLWADARSIIMVAMRYGPDDAYDSLDALKKPDCATISCYAQNRDYHDVMKGKLKQAAGRFVARTGAQVKVFVDTAPVMEKPLAQMAGLGWQGKHTNLVSRNLGSWFFLGSIFTDCDLPLDGEEIDHCGSCRACLDICPTKAFPAPYQLDARRCLSYLTIEHAGPIALEFRKAMGNRIYGCDDCLAVCPWNKFAQEAREAKLIARAELQSPKLADLLQLDDAAFRAYFSGSPIKRIGRNRFIRNCLIAAGNSKADALIEPVQKHIKDADPTLRGAAIWALSQLLDGHTLYALFQSDYASETSEDVRHEWAHALKDYHG